VDWLLFDLNVAGGPVLGGLVTGVMQLARDGAARRRHQWVPIPRTTVVPAWLRGGAPTYPGIFHSGRLDVGTALWRPYWQWGAAPVSMGRSETWSTGHPFLYDGLPDYLVEDSVLLSCEDAGGARFELVIHEDDLIWVQDRLPATPYQMLTRSHAQRWRYRTPLSAVVSVLTGISWAVVVPFVVPGGGFAALIGGALGCLYGAGAALHSAWLARRFTRRYQPPHHIARLDL
jgi:hypothetical protein